MQPLTETAWTYGRATEALELHSLPANFSQWHLANKRGWTVAHRAALDGHLPANFSQWDMADETGLTVAHAAAIHGPLPKSVPAHIWRLTTNHGKSVWDIAKDQGHVTGSPPLPVIKPGDFGQMPPLF